MRHDKLLSGAILIILIASCLLPAFAERGSWDCPNCKREGNTGNFCGWCGRPAPWMCVVDFGDQSINELKALFDQVIEEAVSWTEEMAPQTMEDFPQALIPPGIFSEWNALLDAKISIEKIDEGYQMLIDKDSEYPFVRLRNVSQIRAYRYTDIDVITGNASKEGIRFTKRDDGAFVYTGEENFESSEIIRIGFEETIRFEDQDPIDRLLSGSRDDQTETVFIHRELEGSPHHREGELRYHVSFSKGDEFGWLTVERGDSESNLFIDRNDSISSTIISIELYKFTAEDGRKEISLYYDADTRKLLNIYVPTT